MEPFQLSRTVTAHTSDVRAVEFARDGIVTASRDGRCLLTEDTAIPLVEGTVFLNAVAVDPAAVNGNAVFIGSHNGTIIGTSGEVYVGHKANVCCLDFNYGKLASGSWDHTACVWQTTTQSVVLKGHTQNVWDVKFASDKTLLTASADKTIKLWDISTGHELRTYRGHTDAVRALTVLETQFVSTGNDGTIRVWDINSPKEVRQFDAGHTSFVYTLAAHKDRLVSGGEDRTVRVWDFHSGKCLQTIVLPAISQWSVAFNSAGDFVVGSSDGCARVFTQNETKMAPLDEREALAEAVKSSAFGENEIDESLVVDAKVLTQPGKQEGQVVVVRNNGSLEAHQFSADTWTKLGDVVGHGQSTSSRRETFEGKQYDYVFDVDIQDGAPPLKLPFNNGDNPFSIAEAFVAQNNLPSSYVTQVVNFLITNSQATNIGASSTNTTGNTTGSTTRNATSNPIKDTGVPIVQYSTALFIKTAQTGPLLKALNANAAERGETLRAYNFDSLVRSLPNSGADLVRAALELISKWQDSVPLLLPVYDLLRLGIADAGQVASQAIWVALLGALDAQIPKHCLLATRGVVNMVARADFDSRSATTRTMLSKALSMLLVAAPQMPPTKPFTVALATLALNLQVQETTQDLPNFISTIGPVIAASGDDEALYRLALTAGLRGGGIDAQWFENASESRTKELVAKLT